MKDREDMAPVSPSLVSYEQSKRLHHLSVSDTV